VRLDIIFSLFAYCLFTFTFARRASHSSFGMIFFVEILLIIIIYCCFEKKKEYIYVNEKGYERKRRIEKAENKMCIKCTNFNFTKNIPYFLLLLLFIIYTNYGCALFHSTHSSNVTPLPPKISNAL
jgi:Na+/melibiose symporter-like transporter